MLIGCENPRAASASAAADADQLIIAHDVKVFGPEVLGYGTWSVGW